LRPFDYHKAEWQEGGHANIKFGVDDQISRHTYISSRPKPDPYDLKFFQEWLEDARGGNFPLRGIDRNAWSEVDHRDLLAINKRETNDHFSRWFFNTLIPQFHNKIGWRFKVFTL